MRMKSVYEFVYSDSISMNLLKIKDVRLWLKVNFCHEFQESTDCLTNFCNSH